MTFNIVGKYFKIWKACRFELCCMFKCLWLFYE